MEAWRRRRPATVSAGVTQLRDAMHVLRQGADRAARGAAVAVAVAAIVGGCGGSSRRPPGPDVQGKSLIRAEAILSHAGVGYEEHLEGGSFQTRKNGSVVRRGWRVCGEAYVEARMAELSTRKGGC